MKPTPLQYVFVHDEANAEGFGPFNAPVHRSCFSLQPSPCLPMNGTLLFFQEQNKIRYIASLSEAQINAYNEEEKKIGVLKNYLSQISMQLAAQQQTSHPIRPVKNEAEKLHNQVQQKRVSHNLVFNCNYVQRPKREVNFFAKSLRGICGWHIECSLLR